MMTKAISLSAGAAMIAGFLLSHPSVAAAGANKVKVCHVPPGNPDNFHTITISEKAVEAHLAHGDIVGSCDEHCDQLCDDGDLCTVDACAAGGGCDNSGVTNCDDSEECTIDDCDSTLGCTYVSVSAGEWCDDGMPCTGSDMCDGSGQCVGVDDPACCFPNDPEERCDDENLCTTDQCIVAPGEATGECSNATTVTCPDPPCTNSTCNPSSGLCEDIFLCEPPDACSGVECVDEMCVPTGGCEPGPCQVGICDDMSGNCNYIPTSCPPGAVCNEETGECAVPAECPCWPSIGFDSIEAVWAALAPPNCTTFDACEDVTSSAGLQYSRANCVASDTGYQLQSLVRDFGPTAPLGTRYRCIGLLRVPGQPAQQPVVHLDVNQFEVCLAEHDAFTATTSLPLAGDPPDRDLMCGLPTPGIP